MLEAGSMIGKNCVPINGGELITRGKNEQLFCGKVYVPCFLTFASTYFDPTTLVAQRFAWRGVCHQGQCKQCAVGTMLCSTDNPQVCLKNEFVEAERADALVYNTTNQILVALVVLVVFGFLQLALQHCVCHTIRMLKNKKDTTLAVPWIKTEPPALESSEKQQLISQQ